MPAQVYPLPSKGNGELRKSGSLRGAAELVRQGDANPTITGEPPENERSEFDILLDFLDTDSNGKVSALELADFVDSLLGTQDHLRPQGSIVFEAVLLTALRHSSENVAKDAAAAADASSGPRPGQRPPPPPPPPPPLPPAVVAVPAKSDCGKWGRMSAPPGAAGDCDGGEGGGAVACGSGSGPGGVSALGPLSAGMLAGGPEMHEYAGRQFLSMDAVQRCFAELLADTDLWLKLAASHPIMTTALFRQLLMYSAGGLEKKFSFRVFLRNFAAFNTLPLWLPFPSLWRGKGRHGTLLAVYLHQLSKLHQQLGPWLPARWRQRASNMHTLLVVLTLVQFTATYIPLITFFAVHGIPAMGRADSVVAWMHANPLAAEISFFGSILPWAVLQFLTSSGALKLSCRDFISLKDQCKAVFLLGDVGSQFEGYPGLTLRGVMDLIKGQVEMALRRSTFRKVNAAMPLIFGVTLELFRRLVRVFLVHNLVAAESYGKWVTPFEMYAVVYNIWFAYSEPADCTAYLFLMKKTSSAFKTLLSKEEALSVSLPWLNNHSPRNLLMWSRLRRYYQSPNCLELRWIEMHLTLVVVAAVAVTIILIVTFVQKQLLHFAPENADLQLFMVWVIPAFIHLVAGMVVDVVMSASTGAEYHDGVMTLSSEALAIADRLNSAEEVARHDEERQQQQAAAAAAAAAAHQQRSSSRDRSATGTDVGSGSLRRRASAGSEDGSGGVGALVAVGGGGVGGGGGSGKGGGGELQEEEVEVWRPAEHYRLSLIERAKLRQCQDVIKSLVTYIQFNAEYITLFGVPIDTRLRNTLFSVSVTLVGAGVSAFLAIVVRR